MNDKKLLVKLYLVFEIVLILTVFIVYLFIQPGHDSLYGRFFQRYFIVVSLVLFFSKYLVVSLYYSLLAKAKRLRYYMSITPKVLIPALEEIVLFVVLQTWYREPYQTSLVMGIANQIRLIESIEYAFIVLSSSRYSEFLRFYDMFTKSSSAVDISPGRSICLETVATVGESTLNNLEDSIDNLKSNSILHCREVHSHTGMLTGWFTWFNRLGVETNTDVEGSNESIGNKIDTRHAYLRFIDFVERQDEFQHVQKMSIDKVFVRFGVLAHDVNCVWIMLDAINMILSSTISAWTYHYFGIGSLLVIIIARLLKENYLHDQTVNINYKIVLPIETMVLAIVVSIYYVAVTKSQN